MHKVFGFLFCVGALFGEVPVFVNPQQYFNNTDNYANRVVYFFIEKNADGSVSLQIQPPPFYPSDASFLTTGIAYIDSAKVLQTYTAAEVASLTEVDITFSVQAFPNTTSPNGYVLLGQMFQWILSLDPRSASFYSLQSVNMTGGNSLEVLKVPRYNQENNFLVLYSEVQDLNFWSSGSEGVFLSNSLTGNTLVNETTANTPTTTDITIRVDLSQIATVAVGAYSTSFQFQMAAIETTTTFLQTLNALSELQVVQINYLSNSILGVNAYLDSNNALYDPSEADQVVLRANKSFLLDQYNDTLTAMSAQWDGYAAMTGLTTSERSLITQMQVFIVTAQNNVANFQLDL